MGIKLMSESKSTSGGIGFFGLLAIAFIVLKLCKQIDWPWMWVLSPLWVPIILIIVGVLIWLPFKIREEKNKRNRLSSGNNEIGWDKEGRSKWQIRLEQMQEAQKKRK